MNESMSRKLRAFLVEEFAKGRETIEKLKENLEAASPWSHQYTTSAGTYLGDIYKAIESSLRMTIECKEGQRLEKNDQWHRALLEKGLEKGLIPVDNYPVVRDMLGYRHRFVHGYAIDLDKLIIRDSAPEAIATFEAFVRCMQTRYGITCSEIQSKTQSRLKSHKSQGPDNGIK